MEQKVPDLPYAYDALEPHISARTVEIHYERHHKGYLTKLAKALEDSPDADKSLEELVRSARGDVFNCAAQVWNHTFYWRGMSPAGGGKPDGELLSRISGAFGSFDQFKERLAGAANGEFGSGWAWLVSSGTSDQLAVVSSSDAENPLRRGAQPLLCIDVWEHAYYLDYQNERDRYVANFIDELVNWDFVQKNLEALS